MPAGQRKTAVAATASEEKKPKRAKKPVSVIAVVTPNGIQGSFHTEQRRPLIAHLPVSSNDLVFEQKGSGDGEPTPYDPTDESLFSIKEDEKEKEKENAKIVTNTVEPAEAPIFEVGGTTESRAIKCFSKVDLMVQFKNTAELKQLPKTSDIACFWCAHTFGTQPCIIPEREVNGTYMVYGNFCCPQCAFSHLLQETIDPHVRWERVALLHRIYDREGHGRMFPAPCRESLILFGGPLTIESFRATIDKRYVRVDVHMPPMVSILGSIDTKPIDFFDSSIKNTLVGSLQKENTVKAQEGLRLKRSKPLKDRDSTLDSVMQINIRRG